MNPHHYSMVIQWDDEDSSYIVTVPELPGAKTHGKTYEEAIKNALEVIELWLEVALQEGKTIPPPHKYVA